MAVDTELLHSFCTSIDQTQSMDLSGRKSEIRDACIVAALCFVAICCCNTAIIVVPSLNQIVVRVGALLIISWMI
jgi:hypothetical protein